MDNAGEPRIEQYHHSQRNRNDIEHGFILAEKSKYQADVQLNRTLETEHNLVVGEEDQIVSRVSRLGAVDDPVVD